MAYNHYAFTCFKMMADHKEQYGEPLSFEGLLDLQFTDARGLMDNMSAGDMEGEMELVAMIDVILSEMYFLRRGVSLTISDPDLIEALLRTEYKCQRTDVHLPFPAVELVVPKGIKYPGTDRDVQGGVVVHSPTSRVFDYTTSYGLNEDLGEAVSMFLTANPENVERNRQQDSWTLMGSSYAHSSRSITITSMSAQCDLTEAYKVDSLGDAKHEPGADTVAHDVNYFRKLLIGVLLYIQSAKRESVVRPHEVSVKRPGIPGVHGKMLKKLRKLQLVDILGSGRQSTAVPGWTGQKHASPKAHWRAGCFKMLKHERYERKEDGTAKVIWTRPCIVNADPGESVRGYRKLKTA